VSHLEKINIQKWSFNLIQFQMDNYYRKKIFEIKIVSVVKKIKIHIMNKDNFVLNM